MFNLPKLRPSGEAVRASPESSYLDPVVWVVVSVPIGVDYDRIQAIAAAPSLADEQARLGKLFKLSAEIIGIGVDRLDYTKGIPERLDALDARR